MGRVTDEEVAERRQHDGQPDSNRVADHSEVDVEQHELDPAVTEGCRELELRMLEDVEMDADGEVRRHGEEIGHRQPRQDHVC